MDSKVTAHINTVWLTHENVQSKLDYHATLGNATTIKSQPTHKSSNQINSRSPREAADDPHIPERSGLSDGSAGCQQLDYREESSVLWKIEVSLES